MAWRFVQQPNGLFARFSEIVDNFVAANLTKEQAIRSCIIENNMSQWDAEAKVERAIQAGIERWHEAINTIVAVHSRKEADQVVLEMLKDTEVYTTAKEQCKQRGIPEKYAIRLVHLFMSQEVK